MRADAFLPSALEPPLRYTDDLAGHDGLVVVASHPDDESLGCEPSRIGVGHCLDCRKATGAAFLGYADWPRTAFTVTGAFRTHAGRGFCPTCGSRLFHLSDTAAEIMPGGLDDPAAGLRPTREGWTLRRLPRLSPMPAAGQHERDPS